jgi:hypothetical protein
MQQCQVNFHLILLQAFDPNEWCLKNGLLSGGLNARPLSHESSALSTRPRLLAKKKKCILNLSQIERSRSHVRHQTIIHDAQPCLRV